MNSITSSSRRKESSGHAPGRIHEGHFYFASGSLDAWYREVSVFVKRPVLVYLNGIDDEPRSVRIKDPYIELKKDEYPIRLNYNRMTYRLLSGTCTH